MATATASSPSVVLVNRAYLMVMTCLVLVLQLMMNRFYLSSAVAKLSQQYHTTTTLPSTTLPPPPPHLRQQQYQPHLRQQQQQQQQHRHTQSLPEQLIQDRLPLQQQQDLQDQLQNILQEHQQQGDNDHKEIATATSTATITTEQREHFCSSHVLGEKQTWNHHKKVISYSIFGPPPSSSKVSTATNNSNNNSNNTSNISDNNNSTSTSTSSNTTPDIIPEWVILGMEQNIKDAQLYYPDWIVRIYMFGVPPALQDKWLYQHPTRYYNVELVECYSATLMTTSPSRKMISRFLAYDDPKVYTLVRDADSRLSLREVMAVHEFLQVSLMTSVINATTNNTSAVEEEKKDWLYIRSKRRRNKKLVFHNATNRRNSTMPLSIFTLTEPLSSSTTSSSTSSSTPTQTAAETATASPIYFHVMRDHPHHTVAVMGGMFGMMRGVLQQSKRYAHVATTMSQVIDQALSAKPQFLGGCCGEDQYFLHAHLWPYVRHVTLTHDINLERCRGFGAKLCRDFPLGPRDDSIDYFVGSAFKQRFNSTTEWQVRPQHHVCTLQCHLVNDPIVPTSNTNSSIR